MFNQKNRFVYKKYFKTNLCTSIYDKVHCWFVDEAINCVNIYYLKVCLILYFVCILFAIEKLNKAEKQNEDKNKFYYLSLNSQKCNIWLFN